MSAQIKEWSQHPITVKFLDSLKNKSKGIRYSWFRGMEMTTEDKMYVEAVEAIIKSVTDAAVTYEEKDIDREAKKDEFEI